MIDAGTLERLQECVRRESRSLLQYVSEVPLWAALGDREAFARVRAIGKAQRQAADELAAWLQLSHASIVQLGPFPARFMELNDAAFRYVLPRLIAEHKQLIEQLEADAAATVDPHAKSHLDVMVQLKRAHDVELRALASTAGAV